MLRCISYTYVYSSRALVDMFMLDTIECTHYTFQVDHVLNLNLNLGPRGSCLCGGDERCAPLEPPLFHQPGHLPTTSILPALLNTKSDMQSEVEFSTLLGIQAHRLMLDCHTAIPPTAYAGKPRPASYRF